MRILTCLTGRLSANALLGACLMLPILAACEKAQVGRASVADARTPVRLTVAEREQLRLGMRMYLESTAGVLDALTGNKVSAVAEHARKAGTRALQAVPLSTVVALPPQFVLLGADTHQKFDALAAAAARPAGKREILQHLQEIFANCAACHNSYRVSPDQR